MFAYVTVVDHPYFAVTGKDGTFTIKNVPPGKYKIVALHRKAAPDRSRTGHRGDGGRREGGLHAGSEVVGSFFGKPLRLERSQRFSFLEQLMFTGKCRSPNNPWLHRFAVLTALATLALLGVGGLVTSHGVGMAVPDWPNTYGYNMFFFPPSKWVGGIFYEHSHRLVASGVGLLTTMLAVWLWCARIATLAAVAGRDRVFRRGGARRAGRVARGVVQGSDRDFSRDAGAAFLRAGLRPGAVHEPVVAGAPASA